MNDAGSRPKVSAPRRAYRLVMQYQRRALGALPPELASRIPAPRSLPMNGQQRRREIVHEIAAACGISRVIETGTFRGATTAFLRNTFEGPVATVEADPRFHAFSARRLGQLSQVSTYLGDSRAFLRELASAPGWGPEHRTFVYLDAHWEKDLPLTEELELIAAHWPNSVVMIDDFEVPGDPGYGFDDYGPVGALTTDLFPDAVSNWRLYYPAAHSSEETGRRRGCCVLVSSDLPGVDWQTMRPASPHEQTSAG